MQSASFVHARLYAGDHMVYSDQFRVGLDDDGTPCDGFLVGFNIFDWVKERAKTMNVVGMTVVFIKNKYAGLRENEDSFRSVKFKVLDVVSMTTKLGRFGIDFNIEQAGKLDTVAFQIIEETSWLNPKHLHRERISSRNNIYWAFTWDTLDEFSYGYGVNNPTLTTLDGDDERASLRSCTSAGYCFMRKDEFLNIAKFLKARLSHEVYEDADVWYARRFDHFTTQTVIDSLKTLVDLADTDWKSLTDEQKETARREIEYLSEKF